MDGELNVDPVAPEPPAAPRRTKAGDTYDSVLVEARKRREYSEEMDGENRAAQREDIRFVYKKGAQWAEEDRKWRKDVEQAPTMEFNQLPQFVNQVINDQRQQRPGIRLYPEGDGATEELAKTRQAIIRGIENASRAEAVYDSAFGDAVAGGRGYFRLLPEWEDGDTFNQVLRLRYIKDPLSARQDPDHQEPDGSDSNWWIIEEKVTKEEFKRRWPNAQVLSWEDKDTKDWFPSPDHVIVADYLRRVPKERWLINHPQLGTIKVDELPPGFVGKKRRIDTYRVEWFTIAGGQQVLEEFEYLGTIIPVFCVKGVEKMVDGKTEYISLTRPAHDAMRMVNYSKNAVAERLALTPKAPWVMAEGQDTGHEEEWRTANRRRLSRLIYKPVTAGGNLVPVPQRQQPAQAEAGLLEYSMQCTQDLKSIMGMYENNLGMRGQEVSGKAILARESQGDNATFHFPDNLARAIALAGQAINEVLPYYYDTPRQLPGVNADDTKSIIPVNTPILGTDGMVSRVENDLSQGKYSVVAEAGPSYATKRKEQSESLLSFIQAYPPAVPVAGDLIARAMDWADADVLADRLAAMLPPAIQQMEALKKAGQDPKTAQYAFIIQQQGQALQQAQQQLQMMNQQLEALKNDKSAEGEKVKIDAQRARDEAATARDNTMINLLKLILERFGPQPAAIPAAAATAEGVLAGNP